MKVLNFGNNAGIDIPESVIKEIDGDKRPAAVFTVNGRTYRTTVGVMKGHYLLPLSKREAGVLAVTGAKSDATRVRRVESIVEALQSPMK